MADNGWQDDRVEVMSDLAVLKERSEVVITSIDDLGNDIKGYCEKNEELGNRVTRVEALTKVLGGFVTASYGIMGVAGAVVKSAITGLLP